MIMILKLLGNAYVLQIIWRKTLLVLYWDTKFWKQLRSEELGQITGQTYTVLQIVGRSDAHASRFLSFMPSDEQIQLHIRQAIHLSTCYRESNLGKITRPPLHEIRELQGRAPDMEARSIMNTTNAFAFSTFGRVFLVVKSLRKLTGVLFGAPWLY